jgi:serine/threonine protein kinase
MSRIQKRDAETLKVVTPLEKLDEVSSSRKKFMVEAEKIKQFSDHPHIVDVYDVFDENETCYYTMEYIEGGSLMDYVEQTETCTLQEEEALKIIREVASALSAMHSHRMNHLDVKPENILMSEEGKAVLIDFGAAHKFSNDDEASSLLAITSGGFSPLEIGKIKDFSPSTDIYSLGATLYWLLTGYGPPREGLSERDEKPECISDKVWKVLSLSLQTFREDRPQSIEEFLALLD